MKLYIRFKMLTLWNKLGAIGSVASILALVLFFSPMITGKSEHEIDSQALQSELYIKRARFVPMQDFFVKENGFYETAFLYISIINISNQDILITSLEVVDLDGRGILSPAYSSSGLGPDISNNKLVKISAGDEVEISYSGGFRFSGLVDLLDINELANENYFDGNPLRIPTRNNLVVELNKNLNKLLLGESKIKLEIFTGRNSLIAEHVFSITSGTDIFGESGKIQHPYFLGDLIHWLNSPYSEGILSESIGGI